jgi:3-oxoacyl-[acyl-carrier-protein] synthase-3
MAVSNFSGVRLTGLSCAVPKKTSNADDDAKIFGLEDLAKVSENTGVKQRHVATKLCTSDLCYAAAERLFQESGTERDGIDALVFVSQTPDYILPATSCCLHERLKLSKECASFDIGLGCSGYVYGLWVVANMIASGGIRRALLLVGDTSSKLASPEDRSVALLFGDAGSATLLEADETAPEMTFVLGTDGRGQGNLIVPAGGFRNPWSAENSQRSEKEGGNFRAETDLFMNGAEVFTFTLGTVPRLIKKLLSEAGQSVEDVDTFVFHQANRFMLQYLSKRMKLPSEKVVIGMENFGNTSSASIPLTMVTCLDDMRHNKPMKLALAGFGVGYSWAGAILQASDLVMPELIMVSED